MLKIDDNNWNGGDVLAVKEKMIVKVSATWCGPCKVYKPTFEKFAADNESDTTGFAEADADENDELTAKFAIRGVPATLFFKNGELVGKQMGILTEAALAEQIEKM